MNNGDNHHNDNSSEDEPKRQPPVDITHLSGNTIAARATLIGTIHQSSEVSQVCARTHKLTL